MDNNPVSNRVVVLSDTHFGVIHDPTEDEKTNITDLINLLDLIEKEIHPKTIILLGDIFDLWRVEFEYAWDNAHDIQFFERLSKYIETYKAKGAELIYVIGNHDHFLKEISYAKDSENRYNLIMDGKKVQDTDGLVNEVKNAFTYKNVKVYYPHYKMQFGFGTVYFDHGHFNTKEERQIKYILGKIYKYLSKYIFKTELYKKEMENPTEEEIFNDLEGNFSAMFTLIYHSKRDDIVRGGRDLIWRIQKRWFYVLSYSLGFVISALIYSTYSSGAEWIPQSLQQYPLFIAIFVFIGQLGPKVLNAFLPRILTDAVSSMRGQTVDKVMPEIVKRDISIEKKGYKYINLIQDLGNNRNNIYHYIFAHTHIAGKKKDPGTGLTIYNCGAWVEADDGKSCKNSFIIIDPDSKDDEKIKIFHMEKTEKKECSFDENGKCKHMCNK